MKKLAAIFLLVHLFSSYQTKKKEKSFEEYSPEIQKKARAMTDSIIQKATRDAIFDTVGLYQSPIKVISARLVKREYSNYKDISLTYKNVSNKKINAIRFRWYGLTAFNEPADMGSSGLEGFGSGFDDDPIGPGRSVTNGWSILSGNAKSISLAWAYEVMFSDGTKWKCGK